MLAIRVDQVRESATVFRKASIMRQCKGVMLLPPDSENYRRHVAHHRFLARINKGESIPDERAAYTQGIEARVREALHRVLSPTKHRILRWEEKTPSNHWITRYRELDGVFETTERVTIILEVKASTSKSSLNKGLQQLQSSTGMLRTPRPATLGLLVVADTGAFLEGFGGSAADPLYKHFASKNLQTLNWPVQIPAGATEGLFVCRVPEDTLSRWIDEIEAKLIANASVDERDLEVA